MILRDPFLMRLVFFGFGDKKRSIEIVDDQNPTHDGDGRKMAFNNIGLVTGAAGFMGSHPIEHPVKKGIKARATARPRKETRIFEKPGAAFIPSDLTKPETLPPRFESPWIGPVLKV